MGSRLEFPKDLTNNFHNNIIGDITQILTTLPFGSFLVANTHVVNGCLQYVLVIAEIFILLQKTIDSSF